MRLIDGGKLLIRHEHKSKWGSLCKQMRGNYDSSRQRYGRYGAQLDTAGACWQTLLKPAHPARECPVGF